MSHPSSELLPHDGSVSATGQEPTAAFGLTGGRAAAEATPDRSQAARVEKSCPALTSQLNEAVVSLRGAVQSGGAPDAEAASPAGSEIEVQPELYRPVA